MSEVCSSVCTSACCDSCGEKEVYAVNEEANTVVRNRAWFLHEHHYVNYRSS